MTHLVVVNPKLLSTLIIVLVMLAFSGHEALALSYWVPIRTDDAAWQAACGHSRRVGAVCLSVQRGQQSKYKVRFDDVQNVIFSGDGRCECIWKSLPAAYLLMVSLTQT